MKKYIIISVVAMAMLASAVLAKEFITGYDVNNNFAPVQVEKGVYTPGISLYPYETKPAASQCTCDMLGGKTADDWIVGKSLTVGTDLTVGDALSIGGVEEDWIEGTASDATTTLLAVANPWGATAYVDRFMLLISVGATSSAYITCGTSTAASLEADPTDLLIDDFLLATSTAGTATTTANLTNGDDLAGSSFSASGTNSEDIIIWGASEYITCYADKTGANGASAGGFTESTNQFAATYKIHSFR